MNRVEGKQGWIDACEFFGRIGWVGRRKDGE